MAEFQKLREGGYGTTFSNNYLEQGRYAEAVASTGAEADLVDRATPGVGFMAGPTLPVVIADPPLNPDPAFAPALPDLGGGVTLADVDADGDLDLIDIGGWSGARFHERKRHVLGRDEQAWPGGARAKGMPVAAIAGDYDNDTRADLFVLGLGGAHAASADATAAPSRMSRSRADSVDARCSPRRSRSRTSITTATSTCSSPPPWPCDATCCCGTTATDVHRRQRRVGGSRTPQLARWRRADRLRQPTRRRPAGGRPRHRPRRAAAAQEHAGRHLPRHRRRGRAAGPGAYRSVAAGDVNKDGFTDFYFGA